MRKVAVFLRAVNLPGKRLLMTDFKKALLAAGCLGPETVAAAGNAVAVAELANAALEAAIEASLTTRLRHSTEVYVRDGAEMATILARNPFAKMAAEDPSHLVVVFLPEDPSKEAVQSLHDRIQGPEEVAAGPGCLYATYPDNIGQSKLTAGVIEKALQLRGTARNWNTICKMAQLTAN